MNATLPRPDEDFARTLRDRLDAVAPPITVDTSRVVPAARRVRRRRAVTSVLGATAVVLVGVGWATQPWAVDQAADLRPATVTPPAPAEETPTETAPAEEVPTAADLGSPDAPYWRMRYEIHEIDADGIETSDVREDWLSDDRPGLVVPGDDLASRIAVGPSPWAVLVLDGEPVEVGTDTLYALPTEPAEVEQILRDSVDGTFQGDDGPDEEVLMRAQILLTRSLAPPALRDSLWTVMVDLPMTTALGEVTDSQGRAGEGLELVDGGSVTRLVYDPVDHRVLEVSGTHSRTTYLDAGPADAPPVEPSLEDSGGCVSWDAC